MENPVKAAREKLNITHKELSFVLGVTEQTIRTNERGENLKITKKILHFLEDQGFNRGQLQREYENYRNWKKQQVFESLKV